MSKVQIPPKFIKFARSKANMTMAQASKSIGVSEPAWSMWESGKRGMRVIFFDLFLIKNNLKLKEIVRDYRRVL